MTLAALLNRHSGETVYLVGTGPSLDGFQFDPALPRVLINHAVFVCPIEPGRTYGMWLDEQAVHDPAWYASLPDGIEYVLPKKLMKEGGAISPPPIKNLTTFRRSACARVRDRTREECAAAEILYEFCGTATTAAFLCWFMGAARVVLVGIDGTAGKQAQRAEIVKPFYKMKQEESPRYAFIKLECLQILKKKEIPFDDVSTPEGKKSHLENRIKDLQEELEIEKQPEYDDY